jgi:hypothetical protein
MNDIPEGEMRDAALKRIERLDCGNRDKTLASCDPAAAPPPEVLGLQKQLAAASLDDAAYANALSTELQGLVCSSDTNAIHILRGIMREVLGSASQLARTGREAPALVDFIMGKDCPVSASLTDDDKAKLLQIKQDTPQHRRKTNKPATGPLPARPCALAKLTAPSPQNCAKMIQGVHAPELIAVP